LVGYGKDERKKEKKEKEKGIYISKLYMQVN
jgi:hypothetical protein